MDDFEKVFYLALTRFYVNPIIDETPVRTGVTRASWYLLRRGEGRYELINTNDNIVTYLEDGTRPHIIKPKEKRALAFTKDGKEIVVRKVSHPGFEGKHWIARILNDEKRQEEVERFVMERLQQLFNLNKHKE